MKSSRRSVLRQMLASSWLSASDPNPIFACVTAAVDNSSRDGATPVVTTRSGKVRGRLGVGVDAYLGIPYGRSTAGEGRFRPPRPPEPWTGIRNCLECGPPCFQTNNDLPAWVDPRPASEDCLCLNVWAPRVRAGEKPPVMVWIHGGAYVSGSGGLAIYDGACLARRGAVVVSVNHRLGPFGYLYPGMLSKTFAESGNAGQLDLIAALQWVRDNIEGFGGDPHNVTVFGESGGGGKISMLALMPAARGLFHKAIIQSGSLCTTVSVESAHRTTLKILDELSISEDECDRLLEIPPQLLLTASDAVLQAGAGPLALAPVLDGHTIVQNSWIQGAPEHVASVPFMIGTNIDESAYFVRDPVNEPADDAALRQRVLEPGPWITLTHEQADILIKEYRHLMGTGTRLDLLIAITTDLFLWRDALTQAQHKVQQGGAPVYMYDFTWKTPCFGRRWAPHVSEIPLVFGNLEYSLAWDMRDTPKERAKADPANTRYALSAKMMDAWIAFARSGNPSTPSLPPWPAYDLQRRATLQFGAQCKVTPDPRGARRVLLDQILS